MFEVNIVLSSVFFCLFIAETLSTSARVLRQASGDEDEECSKPPTKITSGKRPLECCKFIEIDLQNDFEGCQNKFPDMRGPRLSGPRNTTTEPTSGPMKVHGQDQGCFWECLFNSSGLLTKDYRINKEAIGKFINNVSSSQPDWSSTLTAGTKKCFDSSVYNETNTRNCKSGAFEFHFCFVRQLFLNCPRSAWSSSDECSEIKARLEKCPHMNIPMMILNGKSMS